MKISFGTSPTTKPTPGVIFRKKPWQLQEYNRNVRLKVIFPPLQISFGASPTTKFQVSLFPAHKHVEGWLPQQRSYSKTLRIASADLAHIFNNKMKIRRLLFLRPNRSKHLGPSQQPNPFQTRLLGRCSKAYFPAPENMFWSLSNRQTQPWFSQKNDAWSGSSCWRGPRGRKITFRRPFLLYSCNCHGFFKKK